MSLFQKNSRHDNGLYAQPQEKLSNEEIITTESKDNTTVIKSESVSASLHEVIDNLDDEEPSNDQESIPYCVKTKPYYSINAKLNQREKTSVPINASVNKYLDKGYSENITDESVSITEDQIAPLEDVKPPSARGTQISSYSRHPHPAKLLRPITNLVSHVLFVVNS